MKGYKILFSSVSSLWVEKGKEVMGEIFPPSMQCFGFTTAIFYAFLGVREREGERAGENAQKTSWVITSEVSAVARSGGR